MATQSPGIIPAHKTKIVATIGPATESPPVMRQMLLAGMSIARLNFSHGDFPGHVRVIANLRAEANAAGRRLAILADLPGPKMRIGRLGSEPVEVRAGQSFVLTTREIVGDGSRASTSFIDLPKVVKPGDTLFLNDGFIQLTVLDVVGDEVRCRVDVGGALGSRKGLNLPGIDLGLSAFTERDRECLRFALEHGVDAVSQSFVESADDVLAVRQAAAEMGGRPLIIAKIERSRALEHIDEILDVADGIMVARGDLGVEIPIEEIAVVQKRLTHRAVLRGKPVIIATHMLESMTTNRRPTRAEATDVANAILDGADCVMLSGESAMGNYPVEAVTMLGRIASATERLRPGYFVREALKATAGSSLGVAEVMARSVEGTLECLPVAAVVVPSRSGATARDIARFRPSPWIVSVSADETVCQNLMFSYGIIPVHRTDLPEDWSTFARVWLREHRVDGNVALLVAGPSAGHPEANHRMEIVQL